MEGHLIARFRDPENDTNHLIQLWGTTKANTTVFREKTLSGEQQSGLLRSCDTDCC